MPRQAERQETGTGRLDLRPIRIVISFDLAFGDGRMSAFFIPAAKWICRRYAGSACLREGRFGRLWVGREAAKRALYRADLWSSSPIGPAGRRSAPSGIGAINTARSVAGTR